jgi:inorganic pyrophosphatase
VLEHKTVEVGDWRSRDDAVAAIKAAEERFRQEPG